MRSKDTQCKTENDLKNFSCCKFPVAFCFLKIASSLFLPQEGLRVELNLVFCWHLTELKGKGKGYQLIPEEKKTKGARKRLEKKKRVHAIDLTWTLSFLPACDCSLGELRITKAFKQPLQYVADIPYYFLYLLSRTVINDHHTANSTWPPCNTNFNTL